MGIGYSNDIDQAKQLMLQAMQSIPEVLKDPAPDVLVMELAESTVNIRVRWWIKPPRRADNLFSHDKVLSTIKKNLTENGIELPFPTQQILFHDQTEDTDGDHTCQREGWPAGKKAVPKPRRISDSLRLVAQMRSQRDGNGTVDSATTNEDN